MLNIVPAGAAAGVGGTVLSIVDLAGSERVKRSGAQGARSACLLLAACLPLLTSPPPSSSLLSRSPLAHRFDEAVSINTSLSALARVVASLVENGGKPGAFVPYRDSKVVSGQWSVVSVSGQRFLPRGS
jgi:hypothetical protein